MGKQILYRETMPAHAMAILLIAVAFSTGFAFYYQVTYGPIGSRPAPNIIYAGLTIFFLLIGINFSAIRIYLTNADAHVSFGLFGKTLAWKDIASCEADSTNVLRYGGWGVRLGVFQRKKVWGYNTFGGKRVALIPKDIKLFGILFSTRNSEEVLRIAKKQIEPNGRKT
jgi:hypothetical protein